MHAQRISKLSFVSIYVYILFFLSTYLFTYFHVAKIISITVLSLHSITYEKVKIDRIAFLITS
jgi:hypothetical protein